MPTEPSPPQPTSPHDPRPSVHAPRRSVHDLPNLQALALFVAVVDEGGLGAGARRMGLHQPNASRLISRLEAEAASPLLDRHPRGARPTPAGLVYAAHARELLAAADHFAEWLRTSSDEDAPELRVGASMTIAEHLVPVWLTELRRRSPDTHVHLEVENSTHVIDDVREGRLRLGFVETPRIPRDVHARVVADDELILVIAAHHPWAERTEPVGLEELAATALVVREGGSGTREALEAVVGDSPLAPPAMVLGSNAAVRIAVASGAGPAVLSALAVQAQLDAGELLRVPIAGDGVRRSLTAVWKGPRRLTGAAAELVDVAGLGSSG